MRLGRAIAALWSALAACASACGTSSSRDGAPIDAGADVPVAPPIDAGGDCPAVCPPASTENFCDNFNRTDPVLAAFGWRLAPDNTAPAAAPAIEMAPCGHLLVQSDASVQMLERTIAEAVNITIDFDLTVQIDPAAPDDAGPDAGTPATTVLSVGASEEAAVNSGGVSIFYTPTQVGVSVGGAIALANDVPPATPRHFHLVVTGRGTNFTTTALLTIAGGPVVPAAVATHFTNVPFKILQVGLRSSAGLGHATARIDNLGIESELTN